MTNTFYIDEINRLKKDKNAVILAHYYQDGSIQDIADYVGDSFDLSKIAASTNADIIVFCGVHFMAETAKILAPDKTVLLPVKTAGCPMADMATAYAVESYKKANPDRKIICYVNTTAEVKAQCDVCVTSSNAEKIISAYKGNKMLYVPDKNLGTYLKYKHTLDIDIWPGFCCIHNDLTTEQVYIMKEKYPKAHFIVHPEAPLDVIKLSDYTGGTKGLLDYVKNSPINTFVIGTEIGIIHQMKKQCPDKTFVPLTEDLVCNSMKKTDLKAVYEALLKRQYVIEVNESIRKKAFTALDLMMKLSETYEKS